jgi:osmotically inducible protein OsmC
VGNVPGITAEQFEEAAQGAKTGCPVSQALSAVPITLETSFTG